MLEATWTVIWFEFGATPHHFGLRLKTTVWADAELISNGPPDMSMEGSTVVQAGFHPTFSMTWAGSRLAKSVCQSAKGVWNTTLTVRPLSVPVTDVMSRYPATLATMLGPTVGLALCCAQA